MTRHNIPQLEAKIREVEQALNALSASSQTTEMLKIIHRPGFTTPAEFLLVSSVVDTLALQLRNVATLQESLLTACREITEPGKVAAAS